MADDEITDQEMKEALARSGYLLEARVAERLRARSLAVIVNVPFVDPITKVTRESDFRARIGGVISGAITAVTLIGECINMRQPLVFMASVRDPLCKSVAEDVTCICMPRRTKVRIEAEVPGILSLERFHHYGRATRIATQFSTFAPVKDKDRRAAGEKWMATHPSDYEGTFPKIAAATRAYIAEREGYLSRGEVSVEIINPVLVVAGKLFSSSPTSGPALPDLIEEQHIVYRSSIQDERGGVRDLLVDVITESALDAYADDCVKEYTTLSAVVQEHGSLLMNALKDAGNVRARFLG